DTAVPTSAAPVRVSCIRVCDVRVLPQAVQLERSDMLDEFEESLLELRSLAGALTKPRPERERMRGHGVDALTLGAAAARDMPSVGKEPHLVELKELRRTISTDRQEHRRAFRRRVDTGGLRRGNKRGRLARSRTPNPVDSADHRAHRGPPPSVPCWKWTTAVRNSDRGARRGVACWPRGRCGGLIVSGALKGP
ncbi:MAG: hypothetical protein QOE10_2737, partial [Gaiellales bacterium]|nr:hypothetical protein [Gaiellales bacterium]